MELRFYAGQRSLPQDWINKRQQDKQAKLIKDTMQKANTAYKSLRVIAKKSFGDMPKDWTGFTDQWLDANVDSREKSVRELPFTDGMIANVIEGWENKRTEAKTLLKDLQAVKALQDEGAVIKEEYGTHILICTNKNELVKDYGKVNVDGTANECWRLLQNCRESYAKLMQFCHDRDLREYEPSDVMRMDNPEVFASLYCQGFYNNHPSEQQEQARDDEAWRVYEQEQGKQRFIK